MPPRGVKTGARRARQYEHIKQSEKKRGVSASRAEEIAARTVNKERARSGEARTRSRTSNRTREQLYRQARRLKISGRSKMNKAQLERAVDSRTS